MVDHRYPNWGRQSSLNSTVLDWCRVDEKQNPRIRAKEVPILIFSRRGFLSAASILPFASVAPISLQAKTTEADDLSSLPPEFRQIMAKPIYQFSQWQIYVADLNTGEPLYDFNGRDLACRIGHQALPRRRGPRSLRARLSLSNPGLSNGLGRRAGAASGRPHPGRDRRYNDGRPRYPDGHVDFESFDHIYANVTDLATLTPEDPLAGLNDPPARWQSRGFSA